MAFWHTNEEKVALEEAKQRQWEKWPNRFDTPKQILDKLDKIEWQELSVLSRAIQELSRRTKKPKAKQKKT